MLIVLGTPVTNIINVYFIHANPSAFGGIFPLLGSNSAIPTGIQIIPLSALFASGKNQMRYICIELCYFGQVVILLFMYFISLCVLFSAYCIVLISFVLVMRKWCIPVLAIQSSYLIIWWLLLYTISCCGLIN